MHGEAVNIPEHVGKPSKSICLLTYDELVGSLPCVWV